MTSDVLLNKIAILENCLRRLRAVYSGGEARLRTDFDLQDVIILNLQRACEAVIDMAAHEVREKKLGIPQSSRDFFDLLAQNKKITVISAQKMKAMVGFRNIAIHAYQKINLDILERILQEHLEDFTDFSAQLLKDSRPA